MWSYHRILQLLRTSSCFNAYLLLDVSIFITQGLLYFPLPSNCSWVYLIKKYKDVNIWCGEAKQEWFNKQLKIKELFTLVWDPEILSNQKSWNKSLLKLSLSEKSALFLLIFPWNFPAVTGWKV